MTELAWIDVRPTQDPPQMVRGIGRYVVEHSRALLDRHPARVAGVIVDAQQPLPEQMAWLSAQSPKLRYADDTRGGPPALLHVMSPFEPLLPINQLWPVDARDPDMRLVVTLYDLIPKIVPGYELSGWRRTRYEARLQWVAGADHLLCLSETTARDAQRVLGTPDHKITVIGGGISVALDFGMSADGAAGVLAERFPDLGTGHVMYVGAGDSRKNLPRLIRAWGLVDPAIRSGRTLVIAGPATQDRLAALETLAAEAGLRPGELLQTGYVSDTELSALYVSCGVFAFPSTYEGYGLPILEAMAFGIPVIAANATTSAEVLGDLEMTFDPYDPLDMAAVLARALTDEHMRAQMKRRSRRRSAELTWGRVADRTIAGYDRALSAASPKRPG